MGWRWALPEPLSAAQLRRLEQHRYSASGRSLLEPPLQLYWAWLVERAPLWLAPNAITLGGFVVNLLPTLLLFAYCPSATEEAPPWVLFSCALGVFIFQSLDAIDGKQARRTNSSSPLGELFDHGCDSVSIVLVCFAVCIAFRLGTNPHWLFFFCFLGSFLVYCAFWQIYVLGMQKTGKIDISEGEIAVIVLFLLTAFGGTAMWDTQVPVLNVSLKMILVAGFACGAVIASYHYLSLIFGGGIGKNGSTIAGTSVLSPGLHIALIIILALMIYKKSTTHVFEKHPCLYALTFGFVCAKITQKLVVAHITKSEMILPDTAFIGPGLLFLNQYCDVLIDEYVILWIALFISLLDLLRYFTGLCIQIAAHLRIDVFKIPPHQAPEQVQNHNE
ncbi:cholinephosphotransferase 1-like [Paroedura picta]|uniref:cholinephosphotransferase 1-like n=1 Tax=Paroedura picta TaxID=143630 RepID=UPI004056187D